MLPWQECSERLIETGELDPTYNLVYYARGELGPAWAKRFCMAHLMFYNVETSITLADVPEEHFWFRVLQVYHEAKRGQERRHFRGKNGLDSIDSMRSERPGMVFDNPAENSKVVTLKTISNFLYQAGIKGFGAYFILKWADFLDVVNRANVDYSPLLNAPQTYLFEGAARGLESIWPQRPHHESLLEIVDYIKKWRDPFQGYRLCGLSEAETIACAYRTYYVKTTYKFGWDIHNLRSTLDRLGRHDLIDGVPPLTKEWL